MITVLIFTLVGCFMGYLFTHPYEDLFFGMFMFGGMGLVFGFLVSMVVFGLNFSTPEDFNQYKTKKKLVALQNNTSIEGSLFLGTGSFKGVKKYYYMVETGRGVNSRSVKANNSYIVEHDSITSPKIVHHFFEPKSRLFYFPSNTKLPEAQNYVRFHIPEGSIKREYNPN